MANKSGREVSGGGLCSFLAFKKVVRRVILVFSSIWACVRRWSLELLQPFCDTTSEDGRVETKEKKSVFLMTLLVKWNNKLSISFKSTYLWGFWYLRPKACSWNQNWRLKWCFTLQPLPLLPRRGQGLRGKTRKDIGVKMAYFFPYLVLSSGGSHCPLSIGTSEVSQLISCWYNFGVWGLVLETN